MSSCPEVDNLIRCTVRDFAGRIAEWQGQVDAAADVLALMTGVNPRTSAVENGADDD